MIEIHEGDCLESMRRMPSGSVHCVVTSPPYWGLRDYGHDGQIGLEESPEAYVARLVEVFREVRRVLRDDGTLWLNLGDSYASTTGIKTNHPQQSRNGQQGVVGPRDKHPSAARANLSAFKDFGLLKPKDLIGIPWRVAFALQADGWYLRQDIIWHKPNPMPESVTDRCTKAHEYVFLLTKSARYFYDAEAIKEEATGRDPGNVNEHKHAGQAMAETKAGLASIGASETRNKRSVWTISTKSFNGAHFAVMPPDLVEPCVLAGTSEKGCCGKCGAPMERMVDRTTSTARQNAGWTAGVGTMRNDGDRPGSFVGAVSETKGWASFCDCATETPIPCTVLDPFGGAGTTALVADRLGRNAIICELNPEYIAIAEKRVRDDNPMFADVRVIPQP
jgi:DNA modification methylase